MNVQEIEREIETVDKVANSNTDMRDVAGHLCRGIWELALQMAIINDQAERDHDRLVNEQNAKGYR